MSTLEERTNARRAKLWDAINRYVRACGGHPSKHINVPTTMPRQKEEARGKAMADVEEAADLEELEKLIFHRDLPPTVDIRSADDMRRLASLYTHDLALPSSTNGELALGACVESIYEMLCAANAKAAAAVAALERVAGAAAPHADCVHTYETPAERDVVVDMIETMLRSVDASTRKRMFQRTHGVFCASCGETLTYGWCPANCRRNP